MGLCSLSGSKAGSLGTSDRFPFRRRSNSIAKISAAVPITPSVTPRPMPIFAPVDIPLSLEGMIEPGEVGNRPFVDEAGDAGVKEELAKLVELPEGLGLEVEDVRATLKPTTAIAPTLDSRDTVVSTMLQSLEKPKGVEA